MDFSRTETFFPRTQLPDPISSQPPSSPRPKHEKFHKRFSVSSKFFKMSKQKSNPNLKNRKHPKLEYLRCKLIRGLKKLIRVLLNSRSPKQFKFASINQESLEKISAFSKFINYNKHQLQEILSTKETSPVYKFKSYNIQFCKEFFSEEVIRECYLLYLEVLFGSKSCKELCKEFKFQCCDRFEHGEDCVEKWKEMKDYVQFEMVDELFLDQKKKKKKEGGGVKEEEGGDTEIGSTEDLNFEEEILGSDGRKSEERVGTECKENLKQILNQPKWIRNMLFESAIMF